MPSPYRYTRPVPKKTATGLVAGVYGQIAEEFILVDGPLMSLSPVPDLLAATWALLREAQVVGAAPRVNREVVAAAVSAANRCQFCVDAHTSLIHASGEHRLAEMIWRGQPPQDPEQARLVSWSMATARLGSTEVAALPFPDHLIPEYFGTALVTHFINRMVSALLNESVLPGRLQESSWVRRVAGTVLGRTVRLRPAPGLSVPLLAGFPAGPAPDWAAGSPVGVAYAALRAAAADGGGLLKARAWELVLTTVAGCDDRPVTAASGCLDERLATLPESSRPGARLALLAALDPHRITDADVAAWRSTRDDDTSLIQVLAFGAMAGVERISASLALPEERVAGGANAPRVLASVP